MSADMIPLLTKALGETVYMVVVSMIIATIIGVPLGVLLHTTSKGQILESLAVNRIVGAIVNAVRRHHPVHTPARRLGHRHDGCHGTARHRCNPVHRAPG